MKIEKRYSAFWPLLIFFGAVLVMDLDQTVKLHRNKLEYMQQYSHALEVQKQLAEQLKWVPAMREDLLRLAPGHSEAAQIVAELHLQNAPADAAR